MLGPRTSRVSENSCTAKAPSPSNYVGRASTERGLRKARSTKSSGRIINMNNSTDGSFFSAKVILAFLFSVAILGGGTFLKSSRADSGVLGVTQISAIQTYATADGNYADGWKWVFNVTVPAGQVVLQMKFADWTGSSETMPTDGSGCST